MSISVLGLVMGKHTNIDYGCLGNVMFVSGLCVVIGTHKLTETGFSSHLMAQICFVVGYGKKNWLVRLFYLCFCLVFWDIVALNW